MNLGKGLIWRTLQQYSIYVVKLLVQIMLSRILVPEEFGLLTIIMVFTSIAEILAISGLGIALVQKKDPDEKDYATAFSTSMLFSVLLYAILFFSAPLIAKIYDNSEIILVLRVYGLIVFFQAYLAVVNAYVQKNFQFKNSCIGNLVAVLLAGVVAIITAYNGAGVRALVIYSALSAIAAIILIQIFVSWHPKFGFEMKRFKTLFSFSWKVLVSSLIGTLLENIYNLTIGKYYGDATLGYYKQGNSYPDAILGQTRTAFGAVILPVYASLQDDREGLKKTIKQMTHLTTAVIFPMAFGLAAIAETFVSVILTDKWLPAVLFLRLECIFYGTLPITTSLGNGLIAIGRSDVSAKIEASKLIATVLCVMGLHGLGVQVLCTARALIAAGFIVVSSVISHNIIGIRYKDMAESIAKPLVLSAIMGATTYAVSFITIPKILLLILQLLVGVGVYGVGLIIFMKEDVQYLKDYFLKKRGHN